MADESKSETSAARFTPDEVIAKQRNKQLMIISGIIVVLAGLVALTRSTHETESPLKEETLVGGTRDEPALKKADVKRVQVWKGPQGDKFELARDGEEWRVPARFNAPADKADVESLLTRVFDAGRLNRPSTTTAAQYLNYSLNDEDAVHLRLAGDSDRELLHILIGRAEGGSRDFVRLAGEGAPEGIFELTGAGGSFDTLYSALKLDAEGKPQPGRWVSTSGFEPMPYTAVARQLTIRDGEQAMTFARKPGSDETADEWQLTSPRKGEADGAAVRGVIDALMNYHAEDIAGRDTEAGKFGLVPSDKQVTILYTEGEQQNTAQLYFGRKEGGRVAVMLKTANKGEFIYWAGDFVLSRVFRSTPEFMRKVRLNLIPDGVNPDSLTVQEGDQTVKLVRESVGATVSWKLEQPLKLDADRMAVSNLLTSLNTMQGYPVSDSVDRNALGVGPGLSKRVITALYPDKKEGDQDGDDTPDQPGEEKTVDEQPKEKPAETGPKLKTAVLYFGITQQGEVPVLRVVDGVEQLYWIKADTAAGLFQPAAEYVKPDELNLLKPGLKLTDVRVVNGEAVLQLLQKEQPGGQMEWSIVQPWDEVADQQQADALVRALSRLQGAKLAEPLDKQARELGDGLSKRQLELRLGGGGEPQTVGLYVGNGQHGLVAALLRRADGTEEYWLLKSGDLFQLFVSPADYRVLGMFSGKVRHILVSWKGKAPGVGLKDAERSETQARELADSILKRAQGGEDFIELQKQFNEDGDATAVYDVGPTEQLVKPFLRLSSQLKVGEVGVVESQFGLHVIKRIE
ncbi:MAG: DUF4340 domain-containing protein [Planctomycetes bacterium]|nr:DUF4340 domain-containing protein [Planctomycetota bacterium]MCB9936379.1 DUF4340 domain-containing protein [Planctomycetota bacterium]